MIDNAVHSAIMGRSRGRDLIGKEGEDGRFESQPSQTCKLAKLIPSLTFSITSVGHGLLSSVSGYRN